MRREQILDAGARLLVTKGFGAMTVVEAAGIAKDTFYLYFDTKDTLVAALQVRYQEALIARVTAVLTGSGDHLPRLDRFIATTVDFHRSHVDLHHALYHGTDIREDESMRRLADQLAAFIASGVTAGTFRVADPAFAAAYVLHGLHGVLPPFLHKRTASRTAFLAAASATRPSARPTDLTERGSRRRRPATSRTATGCTAGRSANVRLAVAVDVQLRRAGITRDAGPQILDARRHG